MNHGVSITTDVQQLEEHQKESAVQNYADTSKRLTTHLVEMTDSLLERNMTKLLKSRVISEDELDSISNPMLKNTYAYQSERVSSSNEVHQEDTTFERVNNLGKVLLEVNDVTKVLEFNKNRHQKYQLHPFITLEMITELSKSFVVESSDNVSCVAINEILNGQTNNFSMQIEKGIRIKPSTESDINTSILQANSHYVLERANDQKIKKYSKRYDSIELFSINNELDYQQVLCIISIIDLHASNCIENLIVVCKYKIIQVQTCAHILPYTELMYDIKHQKLCITICSIEDVNRPLCVIPRLEFLQDQYLYPSLRNLPTIKLIKMWAIDLKYIDRNSWTNYNAMYSIAANENEKETTFLMTETSLEALTQQRITRNRASRPIVDELQDNSDTEDI